MSLIANKAYYFAVRDSSWRQDSLVAEVGHNLDGLVVDNLRDDQVHAACRVARAVVAAAVGRRDARLAVNVEAEDRWVAAVREDTVLATLAESCLVQVGVPRSSEVGSRSLG